jgi:hypothetical protein
MLTALPADRASTLMALTISVPTAVMPPLFSTLTGLPMFSLTAEMPKA